MWWQSNIIMAILRMNPVLNISEIRKSIVECTVKTVYDTETIYGLIRELTEINEASDRKRAEIGFDLDTERFDLCTRFFSGHGSVGNLSQSFCRIFCFEVLFFNGSSSQRGIQWPGQCSLRI